MARSARMTLVSVLALLASLWAPALRAEEPAPEPEVAAAPASEAETVGQELAALGFRTQQIQQMTAAGVTLDAELSALCRRLLERAFGTQEITQLVAEGGLMQRAPAQREAWVIYRTAGLPEERFADQQSSGLGLTEFYNQQAELGGFTVAEVVLFALAGVGAAAGTYSYASGGEKDAYLYWGVAGAWLLAGAAVLAVDAMDLSALPPGFLEREGKHEILKRAQPGSKGLGAHAARGRCTDPAKSWLPRLSEGGLAFTF